MDNATLTEQEMRDLVARAGPNTLGFGGPGNLKPFPIIANVRVLLAEIDRLRAALEDAKSKAVYGCQQCWDVVTVVDAALRSQPATGVQT